MTQGTFIIQSNISEKDLIEWCFNVKYSGYDYMLPLVIHAFAHHWNIDKLNYYLGMLREDERE